MEKLKTLVAFSRLGRKVNTRRVREELEWWRGREDVDIKGEEMRML